MQPAYFVSGQALKAALHSYLLDPSSHGVDASAVVTHDPETCQSSLIVGTETVRFDLAAQFPKSPADFTDCGGRIVLGRVEITPEQFGHNAIANLTIHTFSLSEPAAGYLTEYVMKLVASRQPDSLAMPGQHVVYIQATSSYTNRSFDTAVFAGSVNLKITLKVVANNGC
jgi:hypothetical protein